MHAMRRSLLMFAVGLALPLVLAGAALEANFLRENRLALLHEAQDHAAFAAALLERELASHKRSIQMIAQSPSFDGGFDRNRFDLLAARLVRDEPLWRVLSVSDPRGRRITDVPIPIAGRPGGLVVDLESLAETVRSGQPTVGRIVIGPQGKAGFAVRAPVLRGGAVAYVVSAVVDPSAFGGLLLPDELPPTWAAAVVDGAGNIVATTVAPGAIGSAAARVRMGEDGAPAQFDRRDGKVGVGVDRPVRGADWTVRVAMPRSAYNAPLIEAVVVLVAGSLVSLMLAVFLAYLVLREMRANRDALAAAAERQRLEALGRLTGGVAHDFNNLLTPILGGLDLLSRRLQSDPKGLRLAEGALASAERAKALVARLLTFSRRQELAPKSVEIDALLLGLSDIIEHSVGPDIEVVFAITPGLDPARVDPVQLELAVLNLAVNARDAMPEGGRLTLAVDAPGEEEKPRGLGRGRYIRIAISDTGEGMDPETLARAVEPFFTTKGVGKGTGLGLSMVHGLAAQSGGTLMLASAPGEGTRAEIWLPTGARAPEAAVTAGAEAHPDLGRLLLVDDEELVRASTAAMLRDHGHAVIEAASAAEALACLRRGEPVDALVTDFVMPGRSGAELVAAARSLRPGLKAMIVTGFAKPDAPLPADVPVLAKPFRREELLREVGRLLNAA